jgi:hypothetical protein
MSSSVSGRGGFVTMYLKHCIEISLVHNKAIVDTYVQTLIELLLLFVNYTETEVYFIRLLEVGFHAHDLRKRLLSVLERAIAVIEDTYAVPKLGFLDIISFVGTRQILKRAIPLDQTDDKALAGKQSKPVVNHPSSNSNGL